MMVLQHLVENYESMSSIKEKGRGKCITLSAIGIHRAENVKTELRLGRLMWTTRSSQCHDGQDKIYAVMSMASDIPDWFVVDYTKSLVEVYVDFVRYLMEAVLEGDKLGFLWHCGAIFLPRRREYAA
jgi:hypothetical protein